jgi:hypothetical protein
MKVKLKKDIDNVLIDRGNFKYGASYYLKNDETYEVIEIFITQQGIEYTIIYNKYYFWNIRAAIFDITENYIDKDWSINEKNGNYTFAPNFMNNYNFWEDFTNFEPKIRRKFYRRFVNKILPENFDENPMMYMQNYYEDYQNPYLDLFGTKLGNHEGNLWVLCPKCNNAVKTSRNIGMITCKNKNCYTVFNNPYAKRMKIK